MKYAVYDTKDKCWLGDSSGVKSFDEKVDATALATIITEQFNAKRGRFRALPYHGDAKLYKDELPAGMTVLEAIRKIEGFDDKS